MRSLKLVLMALALTAPALSATPTEVPAEPTAELVPAVVVESAPAADESRLHLTEIQVEERSSSADEAAAAQLGPRGSFWWVVGVIVVAGVILAVLL